MRSDRSVDRTALPIATDAKRGKNAADIMTASGLRIVPTTPSSGLIGKTMYPNRISSQNNNAPTSVAPTATSNHHALLWDDISGRDHVRNPTSEATMLPTMKAPISTAVNVPTTQRTVPFTTRTVASPARFPRVRRLIAQPLLRTRTRIRGHHVRRCGKG